MEPYDKEQMLFQALVNTTENMCMENNLTYCQIIGVLDMVKDYFLDEVKSGLEEGEEDDTD